MGNTINIFVFTSGWSVLFLLFFNTHKLEIFICIKCRFNQIFNVSEKGKISENIKTYSKQNGMDVCVLPLLVTAKHFIFLQIQLNTRFSLVFFSFLGEKKTNLRCFFLLFSELDQLPS